MGSTGKANNGNKAYTQALSVAENKIYSQSTETAVVITSDGTVILEKSDGSEHSVKFTPEEVSNMKNTTLTHNHPSSSTFSWQDIQMLVKHDLAEIRAVAKDGGVVYSLKRNKLNASSSDFWYDYYVSQEQYKKDTVDDIWNNSAQTEKDAAHCNKMCEDYMHKWLIDNASNYGYTYTVQKRK